MSYTKFRNEMLSISKTSGVSVRTKVHECGKYVANFSDGTIITGNSDSNSITVKWGSGHQSMKRIA